MAKTAIYAYGFDGSPQQVEEEVDAIGPTAFDTVILPFIHVHEGMKLYFNETPLEKMWEGLPGALDRLKNGFPVKKRVLISIGPFQSDFDAIKENPGTFVQEMARFNSAHNIDGIDLDYEGSYSREDRKLVATIANRYRRTFTDSLITAAPFTDEEFWAGPEGVLELARFGPDANCFSWFNVQFYEGENNTEASGYPELFDSWAAAAGRQGNGVADAQDFIVPGCNGAREANRSFSPADMEAGLRAIRKTHSSIGGGFVWNFQELEWTPEEWANAIVNGCR